MSFQYENYFYIHGGRDINQGKKGDLCRVDITALIDGKSTTWENIKTSGDSPGNISNHRGCLVNNSLYVFGGVNSAEDSNSNIYILNVDILSWEKIQFSDKDVQPVSSHSMSLVNNSKLVIFGGVYRGKLYNKISIFDIDNNTWTIYPNDSSESVLPDERIEQLTDADCMRLTKDMKGESFLMLITDNAHYLIKISTWEIREEKL